MSAGPSRAGTLAVDEVLVQTEAERYRAVAVSGGRPVDAMSVPRRSTGTVGSIYVGRVVRRAGGMNGAFVDIGLDRPAFLNLEKGTPDEGKAVAVQLVEGESPGKGVRVSMRIALEGRFLVLLPNRKGVAPSRRLEEKERKRLAELLEPRLHGEGIIIRAAASRAEPSALAEELDVLRRLWHDIAGRLNGAPPLCAHAEYGLRRLLCAFGGAPAARFVFAEPEAMRQARSLASTVAPELGQRMAVAEEGGGLFDRYGIADALAIAEGREVPLPSGGKMSIESTAALTAIDVDSGSGSIGPDAALATNLEAAGEIGLQLRLRELGGPVVVDFIRMSRRGDHERVRRRLAQSVESDRLAVQVLGWTQGGLFELNLARAGYEG